MWQIARKEVLLNLLGLRFALGTAICVAMMGVVGYVQLGEYTARQQAYIADVQNHESELADTKVYSRLTVTVDFPPSPLSMFSHGVRDLPSSVRVSPYHIPSLLDVGGSASIHVHGASKQPYNPLLRIFSFIDLSFVIRIVLSLFALLLAFDAYSGEREAYTLALVMACPVRRLEVAAGKFLGGLLSAAVPLTVGFLATLLLWSLSGSVEVSASQATGLLVIFVFSLIYLGAFVALGMWVSQRARDSSSALMVLLLVWVGVAVIVPEGVGFAANWARPGEARETMMEALETEVGRLEEQYWELRQEFPQKDGYWGFSSSGIGGGDQLLSTSLREVENRTAFNRKGYPLKFQAADTRYRVSEPYEHALRRWARLRRGAVRISLTSVYGNLVEAVAGTGLGSYDAAVGEARLYRRELVEYLRPKIGEAAWFTRVLEYPDMELTDANRERWRDRQAKEGHDVLWTDILTWDKIEPLDLEAMPRPVIRSPDLGDRVAAATTDMALLLVFTAAAVILMGRQSLRSPVL